MKVRFNQRTTITVEKGSVAEVDASLFPLIKERCEVVEEEQDEPVKKTATRKRKA